MEDYLEKIVMITEGKEAVTVTNISRVLGVTKPSVISALKKLSERGLIKHERYGSVELTIEGKKIAEDVLRRHKVLGKFFIEVLGIDPDTAWKDACKMEHFISPITSRRLIKFVDLTLTSSVGKSEWPKTLD